MQRLNIAVIGAGISGLSTAWLLSERHAVTLFESDGRLGGHSNTVDVAAPEGPMAVDTGFIVYNTATYPNLIALFDHLGVETAPTGMGFAVSLGGGAYEYSGGSGAGGLFGQPANLWSLGHWQMIRDILRFFREAESLGRDRPDPGLSLGAWLAERRYSRPFIERHIVPMAAAIWSVPSDAVLAFPAGAFARFFANHGLLQVRNRPQWRTVVGGSRAYVERLHGAFRGETCLGNGVRRLRRAAGAVWLTDADGAERRFDHVVLACHGDDALRLLADPSADEQRLLGAFRYQQNRAILHTDAGQMPRRRRVWASWNYVGSGATDRLCVTYWMNALQPLPTTKDYFVTLNPTQPIGIDETIAVFDYAHPVFDAAALSAQRHLGRLQGNRRTWFAGSYAGSGFHEDGLQAGLWVAERLGGVRRPWTVADESARLAFDTTGGADVAAEAAA